MLALPRIEFNLNSYLNDMKTLSDRDLGIECDFVAEGETTDEVIEQETEHIQSEHPDEFDRVKTMMKSFIKTS